MIKSLSFQEFFPRVQAAHQQGIDQDSFASNLQRQSVDAKVCDTWRQTGISRPTLSAHRTVYKAFPLDPTAKHLGGQMILACRLWSFGLAPHNFAKTRNLFGGFDDVPTKQSEGPGGKLHLDISKHDDPKNLEPATTIPKNAAHERNFLMIGKALPGLLVLSHLSTRS